jgi:hypothetical protein
MKEYNLVSQFTTRYETRGRQSFVLNNNRECEREEGILNEGLPAIHHGKT